MKYLCVSDTMPFSEKSLGIAKFNKFNMKKNQSDIPIIKEVISPGSRSTFTIKTKAKKGEIKEKHAFLQAGMESLLLGIINEYTKKNIQIELEQLQRCKNSEVKDLKSFYTTLLQKVKNADDSNEAYLRIGSGKTYYDNTIAQKLSKETLQKIIENNFKRADINFFPVTRTVIIEENTKKVPGWVRISKGEE